jgi:hypothetical protein
MTDESHMLDPEERRRQREQVPARPLRPDANDPTTESPHDSLANPAEDPDPTEYPDPYERRPDPRDPAAIDTPAAPADGSVTPTPPGAGNTSTSEPHPPRSYDELKPVKGDREGG